MEVDWQKQWCEKSPIETTQYSCRKLAWSMFYGDLEPSELDNIQTMIRNYCVLSMDWYLCHCLMFLRLILCESHCVLDNYFCLLFICIFCTIYNTYIIVSTQSNNNDNNSHSLKVSHNKQQLLLLQPSYCCRCQVVVVVVLQRQHQVVRRYYDNVGTTTTTSVSASAAAPTF